MMQRYFVSKDYRRLRMSPFKICIVDEASQCVEPEMLIPFKLGFNKMIMVGDPAQLPGNSPFLILRTSRWTKIKSRYVRYFFSFLNLCSSQQSFTIRFYSSYGIIGAGKNTELRRVDVQTALQKFDDRNVHPDAPKAISDEQGNFELSKQIFLRERPRYGKSSILL